ncbi:D-TA family PLP-dependent enzyme [Rhizobiales bacterium TNE-4]|nr:D-TA family PLP-dependent enzyme [Rhizobiales bacterium TNE-4]MBV1828931.1 D-TA family PLP-dependent enzyme [Rhizobiales bacterium TNE-4]
MSVLNNIETPAVLIDEDIVDRNIAAAQGEFNRLGIAFRPHIKTHKLVRFAKKQIAAGAIGITCQKTSEAEAFVEAGCKDVLITFNIIGEAKIRRLRRLSEQAAITVVADNDSVIRGLSKAFDEARKPLRVLVECDTGLARCGVQSPDAAVQLARLVTQSPGLQFAGLMTYPAPNSTEQVESFLREAKARCLDEIGHCETISSGGTPSMKSISAGTIVTEYRPGTYIYNDRSLIERGAAVLGDCALSVAATVVSRPTPDRAILDSGSKTLSSDLLGLTGYGLLRDYPDAIVTGLSEEHGHVDLSACARKPEVGDTVLIIPNHACVVTNLFDQVHLHRSGVFVETLRVDARGLVS